MKKLKFATVNVGSMRGREGEVSDMLERKRIDIGCLQETRWKGGSARMIGGYKFFWVGCKEGISGVGVMVAKAWVDNVVEVRRVSDRMIVVRLSVGKVVLNVVSVYAPQVGRLMEEKEEFYVRLGKVIEEIEEEELVVVGGDFNGHVGRKAEGFVGVHGGKGFGERNVEGEMLLEFADAKGLVVGNTWFDKDDGRKVSYESGGCKTVVDYILVRRRELEYVTDVTVIRNEPCITQHKLMICKMVVKGHVKRRKDPFVSRCKLWKLRQVETQKQFSAILEDKEKIRESAGGNVEDVWKELRECLIEGGNEVCGRTKGPSRHKQSWWWNDKVAEAIEEKIKCYQKMKESEKEIDKEVASRDKLAYNQANKFSKKLIASAKEAERKKLGEDLDSEEGKGKLFRMVKQMTKKNRDISGAGCIKDTGGKIVVEEDVIKEVWRAHFEKLSNEEFDWDRNSLDTLNPVSGPGEEITCQEVRAAMAKMKNGKAVGPSGVAAEMLKGAGEVGIKWMTELCNAVVREGRIPEDWKKSWMVSIYKGKGDALECGSYRGIKLMEHAMKVFERVIETRVRRKVNIDSMQCGFCPGKGTIDAIFVLRQLQEKYLAVKKELWVAFVDLEKAFDRVPREVLWWALREVGLEEWLIAVIQSMYEGANTSIKLKKGESGAFEVKVGVHQGSVLSPLLFIIVMEALSRKFRAGLPYELFYADDLVLIAETEKMLLEKLSKWKENIEGKGLRVNMAKTKIMKCKNNAGQARSSGKWPCRVCNKGVGRNSIQCTRCNKWIHKRCSGVKGRLKEDGGYKCPPCVNQSVINVGLEKDEEIVKGEKGGVEYVDHFCYLGDVLSAGGGAEEASRARVRCAWGKFNELAPIITSRGASLKLKGKIYRTCVQSVLVYGSETWGMKVEDTQRLERTERAMVRRMCGKTLRDQINSEVLRQRLGIESVTEMVRKGRLRWFGHLERMEDDDWVSACRNLKVEGKRDRGRPNKTWDECVNEDIREYGLNRNMAQDRDLWRSVVRGNRPTCASTKKRTLKR